MSTHLYELLQGQLGFMEQERANVRYYGLYTAIVSNNQDPKAMGRVKIKYPWLADDVESDWARVVCLGGGPNTGMHYMPEVDDEVIVAFEHGDVEHPYVIGGVWNGQDAIPLDDVADQKFTHHPDPDSTAEVAATASGKEFENPENHIKRWRSKSGHDLTWNDKEGEEKIIFEDMTDQRQIIFDVAAKKLIFNNLDGNIELYAPDGDLLIDVKTLHVRVAEIMDSVIGGNQSWHVKKDCTWKVDGNTNWKTGKNHDQKSGGATTIVADSTMDVKASANMTIKGAMVLIN